MAATFDLQQSTEGQGADSSPHLRAAAESTTAFSRHDLDNEPEGSFGLIREAFDARYQSICEIVLAHFDGEVRLSWRMQLIFGCLLFIEIVLAIGLFLWLGASFFFAIALAALFLTTFTSFVTLIYLSTARTHRLIDLRDRFVASCGQHLGYQEGRLDHHLTLAEMISRLAMEMNDREYSYLQAPSWLSPLQPYSERLSGWRHWKEVHQFRRLLLESVLEESLSLVRCAPLNIEVHANLANAYVLMATLFSDPTHSDSLFSDQPQPSWRWGAPAKIGPLMQEQFRYYSALAVEEFKIIGEFAPDDPWVHAQLAYSYHDLKMPLEEIGSYEKLLQLSPGDDDARFRLGLLYFQQGRNAQGLEMYSRLRERGYPKAHLLISFYGRHAVGNSGGDAVS